MNDSIFETPEISIVAFNSNYERLVQISSSKSNDIESKIEEIIEDMAKSIWQFCKSLTDGSKVLNLIENELKQVFKSNNTMELDAWGPMKIIVKPPSEATNQIKFEVSSTSTFQFGYLLVKVDGDPVIKNNGNEKSLIGQLKEVQKNILNN